MSSSFSVHFPLNEQIAYEMEWSNMKRGLKHLAWNEVRNARFIIKKSASGSAYRWHVFHVILV